ncbi:hypothetical protein DSL72_008720 [Monilinia vaccinii-corymbosi]|uniref:Chitin-binding type-4 domain-containing protein n=1 Tax=Monilinia vaccinii-corymbosi TaxID=61207 RepID=A0A8A3PS12_9HELO|nr:hypothetical protein DSL72_008720 [Monilinia vaccinii-corymbosi]
MQYTSAILLTAGGLISSVSAHGSLLAPPPRLPGPAMEAACGHQVEVNQAFDRHGNIQGMLQVAASQSDYNAAACEIWLCKGYKFEDNKDKVQSFTPGQVVPFTFNVVAPHTGTANVSIVDTTTNTVIEQLAYWPTFASTATGVKANETSFSIAIPKDLGDRCSKAGVCVIQHWWDAASIKQTYETCVDFTLGGGSPVDPGSSPTTSRPPYPGAGKTTGLPLPTTFATMTKASSTSRAPAVETAPPAGNDDEYDDDDDDTCEA